jgi:hypothetical protein
MFNKWHLLNIYTRITLIAAVTLICYGYVCRSLHLYFFWESLPIGWELLLVGGIFILLQVIKIRQQEGSKAMPLKIGLGLLCFIGLVQLVVSSMILHSDSLVAAKQHLLADKSVQLKVGTPHSFVLVPAGGISQSTSPEGTVGSAEIHLIVKGTTGIIDAVLIVERQLGDNAWKVVAFK